MPQMSLAPRAVDFHVGFMSMLRSVRVPMFSAAMGAQKLGQPVPESYFVSELKRASPQQMQRNSPRGVHLIVSTREGRIRAFLASDVVLLRA